MSGSFIGTTLYISTTLPATNDAAGFAALTWTKVNGLQTAPQFGVSHNDIPVPDLQTGFTSGVKGAGTGNDSTMTFRAVAGDTGQAALRTAADAGGDGGNIAVKVGIGSGTAQALVTGDPVQYAQGYVHSYVENQRTDSTHEGFSVNFRQNALTIEDTEPAA